MCTIHNQRGRYRERAHRLVMEGYCGWMSPTTGPAASFWPGHFPDILVSNPKPVSRRLPRLPTPECYSKPSEIEKLTDSLRYTLRFAQSRRELSATPLFFAIRALFFKSDRFCLDVIAVAGGFVHCDAIRRESSDIATLREPALIVTTRAQSRGRFVEDDPPPVDVPRSGMAVLAGDILVRPLQRKIGLRFVIKGGRLPLLRVVTRAAVLRLTCFDELPAVRILVTGGTFRRRRFE